MAATMHGNDAIIASRFAVLHEEDDDDENSTDCTTEKSSNAAKNAKKRARKKKKNAEESAKTNEIRSLAFSKTVSAKAIQNVHQKHHPVPEETKVVARPPKVNNNDCKKNSDINNLNPDWQEWKNKDEKLVTNQFQKDLEDALRISMEDDASANNSGKRKPPKKHTMSLEEFSKTTIDNKFTSTVKRPPGFGTNSNDYWPEELHPNYYQEYPFEQTPSTTTSTTNHTNKKNKKKKKKDLAKDTKDLTSVLSELHYEENANQSKIAPSTNAIDTANMAALRHEIEHKDDEILKLNLLLESAKVEVTQVKLRNKQLCFILAQGEMKDKSEVLLQVEELTAVKNELSEQLSEMHRSLERERSKVTVLKSELFKYQGIHNKTKSWSEEK